MGRRKLVDPETVLATIQRWIVRHGIPPTVEELRRALKIGSTRTALRYLEQLEEAGQIRRWKGARGLQLLNAGQSTAETVPVPLVGEAPAGLVMLAEQNVEGWLRVPKARAKPPSGTFFLLRVRGDSMNRAELAGDPIEDGDLVLVHQQQAARAREIVVALIDGEATIKRLAKGPGYYLLLPESRNRGHKPILMERDFRIQGVVRRVFKKGSDILAENWQDFLEES